jgi:hypothetical protein
MRSDIVPDKVFLCFPVKTFFTEIAISAEKAETTLNIMLYCGQKIRGSFFSMSQKMLSKELV